MIEPLRMMKCELKSEGNFDEAGEFEHKERVETVYSPVPHELRRLPLKLLKVVKLEQDEQVALGVIVPIDASKRILGTAAGRLCRVRLCVDLRQVNQTTISDVLPLPHIENLST